MSSLQQRPHHDRGAGALRSAVWERRLLLAIVGSCSVLAGWIAPVDGLAALLLLGVGGVGAARYISGGDVRQAATWPCGLSSSSLER
jgi:hypothetical protein